MLLTRANLRCLFGLLFIPIFDVVRVVGTTHDIGGEAWDGNDFVNDSVSDSVSDSGDDSGDDSGEGSSGFDGLCDIFSSLRVIVAS